MEMIRRAAVLAALVLFQPPTSDSPHLQLHLQPQPINPSPSLHHAEDETSSQVQPPNSHRTCEMPTQPRPVYLEDWFSLLPCLTCCLLVIFCTSVKFYSWRRHNKLANDTKVRLVTSKKKKKKKAGKSKSIPGCKIGNLFVSGKEIGKGCNGTIVLEGAKIGNLFVFGKEIGKGRNGTIVLEGTFYGHPVAVKRILKMYHDVAASKEINHFMESDRHPNIVRFYGVKQHEYFVYVVLERCICSLHELILSGANSTVQLLMTSVVIKNFKLHNPNGHPSPALLKIMRDTVAGLAYLHKEGIIHHNLKPKNVLIQEDDGSISAKLSDIGHGSLGWQSPEQLEREPQSCATDLFSFGCLLFFSITGGQHPFGDVYDRDSNILKDKKNLSLVCNVPEAFDLISHLLHPNPKSRPTAAEVLDHPLFWNPDKRLSFLRDASDFVVESNHTPELLEALKNINKERKSAPACDWNQRLDVTFFDHTNFKEYDYNSIRDLLCVIRNVTSRYMHFQAVLGPYPAGFDSYFSSRFPKLLMEVYKVLQVYCRQEGLLNRYYKEHPY